MVGFHVVGNQNNGNRLIFFVNRYIMCELQSHLRMLIFTKCRFGYEITYLTFSLIAREHEFGFFGQIKNMSQNEPIKGRV